MTHRYGYTEEHELFRRTARQFFDKELNPHYRRYAEAGGVDKEFWRKAGQAGLLGSGIPRNTVARAATSCSTWFSPRSSVARWARR